MEGDGWGLSGSVLRWRDAEELLRRVSPEVAETFWMN
jgi:hypothetical protein